MKLTKFILIILVLIMVGTIVFALFQGDFSKDGKALLENPWGIMSLVDLYTGFIIFTMWIFYKEDSFLIKGLWFLGIMITGFLAVCLYCLVNIYRSQGRWDVFFLKEAHVKK